MSGPHGGGSFFSVSAFQASPVWNYYNRCSGIPEIREFCPSKTQPERKTTVDIIMLTLILMIQWGVLTSPPRLIRQRLIDHHLWRITSDPPPSSGPDRFPLDQVLMNHQHQSLNFCVHRISPRVVVCCTFSEELWGVATAPVGGRNSALHHISAPPHAPTCGPR